MSKKSPVETIPETFILESLTIENEENQEFDGKLLYETLKLQGKNPKYFYFRTKPEFKKLIDMFHSSGYRYLHLSCHGSEARIDTTLDRISFDELSELVRNKLKNRRLFISGCYTGNKLLCEKVSDSNKGIFSIIAPTQKLFFNQTIPFWSSFYYLMDADSETGGMKKARIEFVLKHLTQTFNLKLAYYYHDTCNQEFVYKVFEPDYDNFSDLGISAPKEILD